MIPIRTVRWPDELQWLLEHLKPDTRQDWIETPMERGPPKRRPRTSPYPVLVGTVRLTALEKAMLDRFIEQTGRVPVDLGADAPAKTIVFPERPYESKTTTLAGSSALYEVGLLLRVISLPTDTA